jgi:hypothetical protein
MTHIQDLTTIIVGTGTTGDTLTTLEGLNTQTDFGIIMGLIVIIGIIIGHLLDRRLNQKIDQELNHLNDVQLDNQE